MYKRISVLSKTTGISRFVFAQNTAKGRLGDAVRIVQETIGQIYEIDDEHTDYLDWLGWYQKQPHTRGRKPKIQAP